MENTYEKIIKELISDLEGSFSNEFESSISDCIKRSADAIKNRHTIFTCGNGGSASTASHIANDLQCHLRNWKREGYKVLCINDSVSTITSLTNDYGFENVFARQLTALGEKGDVLWTFSTSGNSKNCVNAVKSGKGMGITTVAITGKSGGLLKDIADIWLPVNSTDVTRVEELHLVYAHILAENIELIVSGL